MLLYYSGWWIQQIFTGYFLCVWHCKMNAKVNNIPCLFSRSLHSSLKDRHLNRALCCVVSSAFWLLWGERGVLVLKTISRERLFEVRLIKWIGFRGKVEGFFSKHTHNGSWDIIRFGQYKRVKLESSIGIWSLMRWEIILELIKERWWNILCKRNPGAGFQANISI